MNARMDVFLVTLLLVLGLGGIMVRRAERVVFSPAAASLKDGTGSAQTTGRHYPAKDIIAVVSPDGTVTPGPTTTMAAAKEAAAHAKEYLARPHKPKAELTVNTTAPKPVCASEKAALARHLAHTQRHLERVEVKLDAFLTAAREGKVAAVAAR